MPEALNQETLTVQENTMQRQFRQGDVFLRRVEALPPGEKSVPRGRSRVVLAEGELSGHAHVLPARHVRVFRDDASARSFVLVRQRGSQLQHEEHAPIAVPEGIYEVVRQREYEPLRARLVAD